VNQINRTFAYILFLTPALFAQSPFDGTWRTNFDQSKLSPKPNVFSLNNGMYDCSSCVPKINVKADGTDQPVTGQTYDTINVREESPKSIAVTTKKNGKIVSESTRTVSDDGRTLTVKTTGHPENSDQTVTSEVRATRVAKGPAVSNETSGAWRISKVQASENGRTTTFKASGDELTRSDATGESYTAKLDGKDYPVKGSYFYNSVALKRVGNGTIEETQKRDGKVVEVNKMTVSPDGKKMTIVSANKLTGRTSTIIADKQ